MNRRVFLSSGLGAASLWSALMPPSLRATGPLLSLPQGVDEGIVVRAGDDRFQKRRRVLGDLEIDIKVSGQDTGGRLLMIEHTDPHAGGPPRHIHTGQDEWFYVLEGRYALEIGEARYTLHPGDAALAPQGIPHVWAHLGDDPGRMIIGFQPAGQMEAFFDALSAIDGMPDPATLRRLFSTHGMEIVGPPLLNE